MEGDFLSELRHTNVVALYRVLQFRWPNAKSIVLDMENCEVGDVQNATLSTAEIRECCNQILSALRYLDSRHIIHRDIKHEDILRAGESQLKPADIGVAQAESVARTECGTPGFLCLQKLEQ